MQKHIYDLQHVEDLRDGEVAYPGPGIKYGLRTMENRTVDTEVECVFRDGETLFARTADGEKYPVSGHQSHVLVPRGL